MNKKLPWLALLLALAALAGPLPFGSSEAGEAAGPPGTIEAFAGTGAVSDIPFIHPCCGDGGLAVAATFGPFQFNYLATDLGDVVIGDSPAVRRVHAGAIWTAAGASLNCSSNPSEIGDGGPASAACLGYPADVAFDANGNLFITSTCRVRRVDAETGIISTYAGTGDDAWYGCVQGPDGGPAATTQMDPTALALDPSGNLFVSDYYGCRIRKVAAGTTIVSTVAGYSCGPASGDGGPATEAVLYGPLGMVSDAAGNLYVSETGNCRIRRIDASSGIITTVAGIGDGSYFTCGSEGDGGPATAASLNAPRDVAVDAAGDIYIAAECGVRKVSQGIISTVVGNQTCGDSGDGGSVVSASLINVWSIAVDDAGDLYISTNNRVRVAHGIGAARPRLLVRGAMSVSGNHVRARAGAPLSWICLSGGPVADIALRFHFAGGAITTEQTTGVRLALRSSFPTSLSQVSCDVGGVEVGRFILNWWVPPVDPSGVVMDGNGVLLADAAVSLEHDAGTGFVLVDPWSGTPAIDPAVNPQFTAMDGHFGWDVEAGTYRVVAHRQGCTSATSPSVSVPPPVVDLVLVLVCADGDGDGLPDYFEDEIGLDPAAPDTDGDGQGDALEDLDADGLSNLAEFMAGSDPLQADSDLDASNDAADNCPLVSNPSQANSDGNYVDLPALYPFDDKTWPNSDEQGDGCDTDDDNDGRTDTVEAGDGPGGPDHASCLTASANTSPILRDSDGDEVLDGAECALGSDPMNFASRPVFPSAANDPDNDRLSTAFETSIGTNPNNADTDGDGLKDGIEYKAYNSNPLSTNTDGDLCPDIKEVTNVDGNTATNANDLATVAGEFNKAIPLATADFDVDKNTTINAADLALIASKVPSFCP